MTNIATPALSDSPRPHRYSGGSDNAVDDDERQQEELLNAVARTIHHFFGGVARIFAGVQDPRNVAKSVYPLPALLTTGLLMFIFHLEARRQIALLLGNQRGCRKMKTLCKVERIPHGDTVNAVLKRLNQDQMQEVICAMVERLIRNKVLDQYRFLGRFVIAVDGTGLWTFSERHCDHCLTKTHNGQTTYYHSTLEAKLVTTNGFAFSLMTEFIENGEPSRSKQDCELRAFYRLAQRLKKRFPRLSLLFTLDGLYAVGPVFDLCERFDWKYLAVLKDGSLPSVNREFASLRTFQAENRITIRRDKRVEEFSWANDIDYTDTAGHAHKVHVLQCNRTEISTGTTSTHRWVTNVKIRQDRAMDVADGGGWIRWNIENEGFNVQKNRGYGLGHAYSKNLALRLLEAWRNLSAWTADALSQLLRVRIQIRFDST